MTAERGELTHQGSKVGHVHERAEIVEASDFQRPGLNPNTTTARNTENGRPRFKMCR